MHQYQERDREEDRQARWTCQEKGRRARAKKVDMYQKEGKDGEEEDMSREGKKGTRGRQTTRWTCQEKGRRARAKKNVRCTSTRKETERKTDNQVDMSREGKKGTC